MFLVIALAAAACGGGDSGRSTGPGEPPAARAVTLVVSAPATSLALRDSMQLTATAKDTAGYALSDARVTWASSDTTKARVSPMGVVTGIDTGTVRITAASGSALGVDTIAVEDVAEGVITLAPDVSAAARSHVSIYATLYGLSSAGQTAAKALLPHGGGPGLVMAADSSKAPLLAAFSRPGEPVQLSAQSTALALARLVFAPTYVDSVTGAVSTRITTSQGFTALVATIRALGEAGQSYASSDTVIAELRAIATSLADTAAPASTASVADRTAPPVFPKLGSIITVQDDPGSSGYRINNQGFVAFGIVGRDPASNVVYPQPPLLLVGRTRSGFGVPSPVQSLVLNGQDAKTDIWILPTDASGAWNSTQLVKVAIEGGFITAGIPESTPAEELALSIAEALASEDALKAMNGGDATGVATAVAAKLSSDYGLIISMTKAYLKQQGYTDAATLLLLDNLGVALKAYNATLFLEKYRSFVSDFVLYSPLSDKVEVCQSNGTFLPDCVAKIEVTPAALTVEPSATSEITAKVVGDSGTDLTTSVHLEWSSSDQSIATVSSGTPGTANVTGVKDGGPVTITAAAGGRTASVSITVESKPDSISVTPASGAIRVGQQLSLTGTVYDQSGRTMPTATVEWTSGDTSVATVTSSGATTATVTGVKSGGPIVITAAVNGHSATVSVTVKPPLPIAFYPFDGNARDESGNGRDGTVVGATLTSDRFGNANSAYQFAGDSESFIDIGMLPLTGSFTIAAYIRADTEPVFGFAIVSSLNYSTDRGYEFLLLGPDEGQALRLHTRPSAAMTALSSPLQLRRWYFVAATFSQGVGRIYVDGVLVDSTSGMPSSLASDLPTFIGTSAYRTANFADGAIDNVSIFDRALDASDIEALFRNGGRPQ